jgi:hypothetical protein
MCYCILPNALDLVSKTCVPNCGAGFYADATTRVCTACTAPCAECIIIVIH